jgi:hypothetical protein
MKLPIFLKRPSGRIAGLFWKPYGLPMREALRREWANGVEAIFKEGVGGAARFKSGLGRLGDFANI